MSTESVAEQYVEHQGLDWKPGQLDKENKKKKGDPVDTGEPDEQVKPEDAGVKATKTGDRIADKKEERGEKTAAKREATKKTAKK